MSFYTSFECCRTSYQTFCMSLSHISSQILGVSRGWSWPFPLEVGVGPSFSGCGTWPFLGLGLPHPSWELGKPSFSRWGDPLGLGLDLSFLGWGLGLPCRDGDWPFLLGVGFAPSFSEWGLALPSRSGGLALFYILPFYFNAFHCIFISISVLWVMLDFSNIYKI